MGGREKKERERMEEGRKKEIKRKGERSWAKSCGGDGPIFASTDISAQSCINGVCSNYPNAFLTGITSRALVKIS